MKRIPSSLILIKRRAAADSHTLIGYMQWLVGSFEKARDEINDFGQEP
jgi:hypothetical protein